MLVAAGERVEQRLDALKARGVKLALDDFGTGNASPAYLQRLPVDIVKIDRSITAKIDSGEDDLALVRGIVGLGKALGLRLIAEGIEPREARSASRRRCVRKNPEPPSRTEPRPGRAEVGRIEPGRILTARLAPHPKLQKERRIAHGSENPGGKT